MSKIIPAWLTYLRQPYDDYTSYLFWAKLNNFRQFDNDEFIINSYTEDVYGNWVNQELVVSEYDNPFGVPIVYVLNETIGNNN